MLVKLFLVAPNTRNVLPDPTAVLSLSFVLLPRLVGERSPQVNFCHLDQWLS